MLAENMGENADWLGQLAELWEIRGDGSIPGAYDAEASSFSASFGANAEEQEDEGLRGAPYGEYEFRVDGDEE